MSLIKIIGTRKNQKIVPLISFCNIIKYRFIEMINKNYIDISSLTENYKVSYLLTGKLYNNLISYDKKNY